VVWQWLYFCCDRSVVLFNCGRSVISF